MTETISRCACLAHEEDEDAQCDLTVGGNPYDVEVEVLGTVITVCDWCDEYCRDENFGREAAGR